MNKLLLLAVFMACFGTSILQAQVPYTLNYQGYITDNSNNPITKQVDLYFAIYDAETGGTLQHGEALDNYMPANGYINVYLGAKPNKPIPSTAKFNKELWLELTIDGYKMSERIRMAATPYAIYADKAGISDFADTAYAVANASIKTAAIADTSITAAKINKNGAFDWKGVHTFTNDKANLTINRDSVAIGVTKGYIIAPIINIDSLLRIGKGSKSYLFPSTKATTAGQILQQIDTNGTLKWVDMPSEIDAKSMQKDAVPYWDSASSKLIAGRIYDKKSGINITTTLVVLDTVNNQNKAVAVQYSPNGGKIDLYGVKQDSVAIGVYEPAAPSTQRNGMYLGDRAKGNVKIFQDATPRFGIYEGEKALFTVNSNGFANYATQPQLELKDSLVLVTKRYADEVAAMHGIYTSGFGVDVKYNPESEIPSAVISAHPQDFIKGKTGIQVDFDMDTAKIAINQSASFIWDGHHTFNAITHYNTLANFRTSAKYIDVGNSLDLTTMMPKDADSATFASRKYIDIKALPLSELATNVTDNTLPKYNKSTNKLVQSNIKDAGDVDNHEITLGRVHILSVSDDNGIETTMSGVTTYNGNHFVGRTLKINNSSEFYGSATYPTVAAPLFMPDNASSEVLATKGYIDYKSKPLNDIVNPTNTMKNKFIPLWDNDNKKFAESKIYTNVAGDEYAVDINLDLSNHNINQIKELTAQTIYGGMAHLKNAEYNQSDITRSDFMPDNANNYTLTSKGYVDALFNGTTINTSNIADGAITTQKLADNAITTNKIVAQAITATQIADNTITEQQLKIINLKYSNATTNGMPATGADVNTLATKGYIDNAVTSISNTITDLGVNGLNNVNNSYVPVRNVTGTGYTQSPISVNSNTTTVANGLIINGLTDVKNGLTTAGAININDDITVNNHQINIGHAGATASTTTVYGNLDLTNAALTMPTSFTATSITSPASTDLSLTGTEDIVITSNATGVVMINTTGGNTQIGNANGTTALYGQVNSGKRIDYTNTGSNHMPTGATEYTLATKGYVDDKIVNTSLSAITQTNAAARVPANTNDLITINGDLEVTGDIIGNFSGITTTQNDLNITVVNNSGQDAAIELYNVAAAPSPLHLKADDKVFGTTEVGSHAVLAADYINIEANQLVEIIAPTVAISGKATSNYAIQTGDNNVLVTKSYVDDAIMNINSSNISLAQLNDSLIKYADLDTLSYYPTLDTLSYYADLDTLSYYATLDTLSYYADLDTLSYYADLDTLSYYPTLDTLSYYADLDTLSYYADLDTLSYYPTLDTLSYYATLDTLSYYADLDTLSYYPTLDTLSYYPTLDTLSYYADLDTLSYYADLDTLSYYPTLDTLSYYADLDTLSYYPTLDTLSYYADLDTLSYYADLDTLSYYATLDTLSYYADLDTLSYYPTLDTLSYYPTLDTLSYYADLDTLSYYADLDTLSYYADLDTLSYYATGANLDAKYANIKPLTIPIMNNYSSNGDKQYINSPLSVGTTTIATTGVNANIADHVIINNKARLTANNINTGSGDGSTKIGNIDTISNNADVTFYGRYIDADPTTGIRFNHLATSTGQTIIGNATKGGRVTISAGEPATPGTYEKVDINAASTGSPTNIGNKTTGGNVTITAGTGKVVGINTGVSEARTDIGANTGAGVNIYSGEKTDGTITSVNINSNTKGKTTIGNVANSGGNVSIQSAGVISIGNTGNTAGTTTINIGNATTGDAATKIGNIAQLSMKIKDQAVNDNTALTAGFSMYVLTSTANVTGVKLPIAVRGTIIYIYNSNSAGTITTNVTGDVAIIEGEVAQYVNIDGATNWVRIK